MKRAILTAILLTSALAGASPQESGKAIAIDPGSAPTSVNVWVAHRGADSVTIRDSDGVGNQITSLPTATYGFSQPWDIVYLPLRTRVFVSNRGNGTVTVINSDTFQLVSVVDLATPFGASSLGGMSVSAGEDAVFVAGADPGGAAIFRINVPSLAASRVGGKGGPPADDCAAIRAGTSGGSGNATRKIYFTQRATNELSEINLGAGGALSTVTLGGGTLNRVRFPDNMDRTGDHRFVFVACTKIQGVLPGENLARIVRIDPSLEPLSTAVSQPPITTSVQDLDHRVWDVSFGTGPGGINRGFVLLELDPVSTRGLVEIDETGARVGAGIPPDGGQGGVTPSTLTFMSSSEQIFVGEVPGTSSQYNVFNAKFASAITHVGTVGSGASDPGHFALVPSPQMVITDMCPRGMLEAGSNTVIVYGSGFLPGATYTRGGATVGFINSSMVTVDLGTAFVPAGAATLGVSIVNPTGVSALMAPFFRKYTPESVGFFQMQVGGARNGYDMFSVPQYLSLTAFKAALAAQLGPYNPVLYRVFFFRNGRYVELNSMKDDGCDIAGESFWMISRDGGTVTFQGPDVFANAGGDSRIIPLNPGFNMISVPMDNGGPSSGANWANILVTDNQADFSTAQGTTTPFGLGILAPAALEFVNGSYVTADPLITGRGYWVENITTKPAYLVFSTTAIFKPSAAASAAGGPPPAGMNPPPPPGAGIGETGSDCGVTGLEALLVLLAARAFPRRRRVRKLVA